MSNRIPVDEKTTEQQFIDFVNTQIEQLKYYAQLGGGEELTFDALNRALCNYQHINLTLISLYNVAKIEYQKEQEEFEDWFARKFIEIRSRVNRADMSAQKWASQKEIEMMVRVEYYEEYKKRKESLIIIERKVAFLRRLLDSWSAQQYILATLSKNLQSEVNALSVGNNN